MKLDPADKFIVIAVALTWTVVILINLFCVGVRK